MHLELQARSFGQLAGQTDSGRSFLQLPPNRVSRNAILHGAPEEHGFGKSAVSFTGDLRKPDAEHESADKN
jgi:hypothetical protein